MSLSNPVALQALEHAPDALAVLDLDGHVVWASAASAAVLGATPAAILGRPLLSLVDERDRDRVGQELERHGRSRGRRALGPGWVEHAVQRHDDRMVCCARDVTAIVERERWLEERAFTDPLTGLANRALFRDHLAQALARLRRAGGAVAVLTLDLDDFKAINDRHGHEAGDDVLRAVGEALHLALRPTDTVARLGGDEFVAVCDGLRTPADADVLAARVRAALPARVPRPDTTLFGRASLGVAATTVAELGAGDIDNAARRLLAAADEDMYRDKRRRRVARRRAA